MRFNPTQILFALTSDCNLTCPHCNDKQARKALPHKDAVNFLKQSKYIGIKRVGFTGGESFLAFGLLCKLIKVSVSKGYLFDNIMTNGVWYDNAGQLKRCLKTLYRLGYDGSICISVDALHSQRVDKIARFIKTASDIWKRPDLISIASVRGARDEATEKKLKSLSKKLGGYLSASKGAHPHIRVGSSFIRIKYIDLSPIGKAGILKDPWKDGGWFKEDYCEGPGNVLFVNSSGEVKPCCGYASGEDIFTLGNIKRDTVEKLLKNFRKNIYLCAIFNLGLDKIRKRLELRGITFPGCTKNHCYFCYYIFTNVPRRFLDKCLSSK